MKLQATTRLTPDNDVNDYGEMRFMVLCWSETGVAHRRRFWFRTAVWPHFGLCIVFRISRRRKYNFLHFEIQNYRSLWTLSQNTVFGEHLVLANHCQTDRFKLLEFSSSYAPDFYLRYA